MLCTITIILCLFFWFICYLGTGSDEKNVKSLASYPDVIQDQVKNDPKLGKLVQEKSKTTVFVSNLITFSVIFLIAGWFIKVESFYENFIHLFNMGMILNIFDYFVMDLLWWRHTKRIRFSATKDNPELYQDPTKHRESFFRAIGMFLLVAIIDSIVLTLTF